MHAQLMSCSLFPGQRRRSSSAFTMVEMLVTVALVVVLMLAVTQIFSIASRTVGGGQALGVAVRDAQAAQSVLARDLGAAAADAPLVIRSVAVAAFRNREDLLSDLDRNPLTIDLNGNGVENDTFPDDVDVATNYNGLFYNSRNHRIDSMLLFARDRFSRQTGNDGTLLANMTSNEAAIFLHHLSLPHTNGSFLLNATGGTAGAPDAADELTTPGNYAASATTPEGMLSSNPRNLLASQWVLGRVAMLLVEPTGASPGTISDKNGNSQEFYRRSAASLDALPGNDDYTPFQLAGSVSTGGTSYPIQNVRYDLAGTSIASFSTQIANRIAVNPAEEWWTLANLGVGGGTPRSTRFQVDPFVFQPIDAYAAAQQAPVFVPACAQFMLEFAGDYLTQNWDPDASGTPDEPADQVHANYGAVTAVGPDGRVDTVHNGTLPVGQRHTGQVRWYGLPRDSNGDGILRAQDGDVVPVRDLAGAALPFERKFPTTAAVPLADDYYALTSGVNPQPEYTVAWLPNDPSRPKMVRVTLGIDRPEAEGRLADGQSFEYVFKLGQ